MNKNTSKLPDELFSEGFLSHETEFDPAAWERMERLLDKEDHQPVLIVPEQNKQHHTNNLLIITIMTTLSIFSIATWMLFGAGTNSGTAKIKAIQEPAAYHSGTKDQQIHGGMIAPPTDHNSTKNGLIKGFAQRPGSEPTYFSGPGAVKGNSTKKYLKTQMTALDTDSSGTPDPFKDSVRMVTTDGKTYRVLTRKIWVPDEYEYISLPKDKIIRDFWIGMHFTSQKPFSKDSVSPGQSAGFNIQFMSGNRIPNKFWGVYGGFDFGMQFYNRGKKSNVVLNNTSLDSGFTRLRTFSMDFLGRAHLEYARYALIPYVNLMAGPRLYSTAQTVQSYLQLKETESRTSNNAYTSASMMYGVGLGARLRLSPVISLDARYEFISGTPVKLVDLDKSTFNGLSYDLKINKLTPKAEQFKIGIIFDLSESDYEKKVAKKGYYKEYLYDSLYMDPKDSGKIYLPCNCAPCPPSNEQHSRPYGDTETESPNRQGTHNPGNNSGGSKPKSFPGIKPPARTHEN
jgi:hypothetical protein